MTETERLVEQVRLLGGTFEVRGEKITVRYPDETAGQVQPILEQLRAKRGEVVLLLSTRPPGVFAAAECPPLPPGFRLKRYAPKDPPVLLQPWAVVTDMQKFIAACLGELAWRLEHPESLYRDSVPVILAKLAEVGVELDWQNVAAEPEANSSPGRGNSEKQKPL